MLIFFARDENRLIPEIKKYAVYKPRTYIPDESDYRHFYCSDSRAYTFSDTLLQCAMAESEQGASMLTAWKRTGGKYQLITVFTELISYATIDSVFKLGKNKYLIAGFTGWGDAGDGAGSIWFAVWELPDTFRMIYYDKWFSAFDDNNSFTYKYTYNPDINQINLERLEVIYVYEENHEITEHSDFKIIKTRINVDDLSKIDKTADFNNIEKNL